MKIIDLTISQQHLADCENIKTFYTKELEDTPTYKELLSKGYQSQDPSPSGTRRQHIPTKSCYPKDINLRISHSLTIKFDKKFSPPSMMLWQSHLGQVQATGSRPDAGRATALTSY